MSVVWKCTVLLLQIFLKPIHAASIIYLSDGKICQGIAVQIFVAKVPSNRNVNESIMVSAGQYGPGTLSLLVGPSITAFAPDITLAGQQVDATGGLTGERTTISVSVDREEGKSRYSVELPAASAGLMVLRLLEDVE